MPQIKAIKSRFNADILESFHLVSFSEQGIAKSAKLVISPYINQQKYTLNPAKL